MEADILPPGSGLSEKPDEYTQIAPDYTASSASNRVLHINLSWFKYGTDDKGHASAIVLSLVLLLMVLVLAAIGAVAACFGKDPSWFNTLVSWVGNAFLFTAGVAIGKSGKDKQ